MLKIRDFDFINKDSIGVMGETLEGLEYSGMDEDGFDNIVRNSEARALEDLFDNIRVQKAHMLLLYGEGGAVAMSDIDNALNGFSYTAIKDGSLEFNNVIIPKSPSTCLVIADLEEDNDDDPDTADFYFIEVV